MKTPNEVQQLFSYVKSKEEARKVWRDNLDDIMEIIEEHPCGKGWKAFMGKHIPWVIRRNNGDK